MGYRTVNKPALALMILLAALFLVPAGSLEWRPDLARSGEWWRLVTGHLVHLNGWHLALNLAGLALVLTLYPRALPFRPLALALIWLTMFISGGLLVVTPDLPGYRGFSGCLHGLIAIFAIHGFRRERVLSASIMALLTGKLVMESTGLGLTDTATLIGGAVVWQAHALGFAGGTVFAGLSLLTLRTPRQSSAE
ncbi:rhombosortase [Marinobacter sp.]|uniref:rhombosortase n=1 Tax=Marinobacter sp. TaxID=50741 RepID=UPI0019E2F979|nr:rhombosortase [Marinobacter sp.]MBE0485390.1 rhombosortase [Marinobacter sp.]